MKPRTALACLVVAALPVHAADPWHKHAQAPELLPAEAAFRLDGVTREDGALRVDWTIAPGYYLYRKRLAFEPLGAGARLGAPQLPKGSLQHDEHFGDVEVFRETLTARLPLAEGAGQPKRLRIRFQGCADAGVCYPPVTREVALPPP